MKWRIFLAGFVVAMGLVFYLADGRILVTFFLDLVVGTMSEDRTAAVPPGEFSWGTKQWGSMNAELARTGIAFAAMVTGHFLLLGFLGPRVKGRLKFALLLAFAFLLASGVLLVRASIDIRATFQMLSMSGAADPQMLGESMPVGGGDASRWLLALGLGTVAFLSAMTALRSNHIGSAGPTVGSALMRVSAGALLLAGLIMLVVCFGPLTSVLNSSGRLDPSMLAGKITSSLMALTFVGAMTALSGAIGAVAAMLPEPQEPPTIG
ncbi:hypothetical protein HAHE_19980 [Haloferula helveola]|uniref:Uncharacterized protein n=1 Tax=Haloferula helveola TaxID=490095 RepID=A0ABN6H369_9BACT|nr:hypothetical protein HAHE_19980 [Haloferula helveola]